MVFATAILYTEPCYDLRTCTFTDIFNAGYFVMVTVVTVGYGSQVPSLFNPGSVLLSCLIMIFGSLYLSMPLAIVGIHYDNSWRDYEQSKREASKTSHSSSTIRNDVRALPACTDAENARKLNRAQQTILAKQSVDETLDPLDSTKECPLCYTICGLYYDFLGRIGDIGVHARSMFDEAQVNRASCPQQSSRKPLPGANLETGAQLDDSSFSLQLWRVKTRNEMIVNLFDGIIAVVKLHRKICSDIHGLLPVISQVKSSSGHHASRKSRSITRLRSSFSRAATGVFGRARRALSSVTATHSERFAHIGPATWRSRVWDVLDHGDVSRCAKVINRVRLFLVLASIGLFYAQTTPELQATGIKTSLCRRTLKDFCRNSSLGFGNQPGCFVLDSGGNPSSVALNFACADKSHDPGCYGNAYNFGSEQFPSTCARVFGRKWIERICNNRLCKPRVTLFADMESKWIGFEFFFGILFTMEVLLRVVVHPQPKKVYQDMMFIVDVIALFPFYVEIGEIISGTTPVYSVVPTAPSFVAGIRVLKTFRVLKLGAHIRGSEVLARTAVLVYKRLLIPIFFLLIGSVITGAIFFEIERGTECFVGIKCVWWGKELLTPEIVGPYPFGKRILVQNIKPSLLTDMARSTWFSLTTITTVGYGDVLPRTALGRFFDIMVMVMSACYTAMPLTLVGGQFFVCYETYLREKRYKRGATTSVEPKPALGYDEANASVGQREAPLTSLAGLVEAVPVIPGLNVQAPKGHPPRTRTMESLATNMIKEANRPSISGIELDLLNRFFRVAEVLNEVVKDLGKLNKLGSQRAALKRDKTLEIGTLLEAEAAIEATIDGNLLYCETVLLQFAPVIEKFLCLQDLCAASRGPAAPSVSNSTPNERPIAATTE